MATLALKITTYVKQDGMLFFSISFLLFVTFFSLSNNIPVYYPVVVIVAPLLLFVILKYPKIGLYLVVFNLPLNQYIPLFNFGGDKFSISTNEIFLFFLLIALLLKKLYTGKLSAPSSKLNRPILFLLFFNILSLLFAINDLPVNEYVKCWFYFFLWAEYFLLFFLVLDLIHSDKEIKFVLFLILFSGIITIVSAIYHQIVGAELRSIGIITETGQTYYRLEPIFGFFSNHYGSFLLIILSILIHLFFSAKKSIRLLLLILILPTFYTLFFTFSRGSFLGLIALVLSLFLIRKKERKEIIIITIVFSVIALILFTPVFLRWTKNTLAVKSSKLILHHNVSERLAQWDASIHEFTKNPILGGGYYTYHYRDVDFRSYFGKIKHIEHAHNIYIRILIESGILGLLSLFTMIYVVFYYATRLLKKNISKNFRILIYITITAFSCFLVTSLTDSLMNTGSVFGPIIVLVALMFKKAKIEAIQM